jgi:hypothetical protein
MKRLAAVASLVKPMVSPPVLRYWPDAVEPETLSMKPVHAAGGGGDGVKVTMTVSTWVVVATTDSITVVVEVVVSGTIVVIVEVSTTTVVTVRVSVRMPVATIL